MKKSKEMCKRLTNFLRSLFGWGIYLSLFAGGSVFLGYVAALCIGGQTATVICLFLSGTVMPLVIKISTAMVLLGILILYLSGETALTSGKKKNAA